MNSYFPHDSNARNSDKLLPVRMKYGAEGYGIYFMLLERLREEKNYMSVKDYNVLAFDLRVDTSKIKDLVENFGLFAFTENGECFYSEGFNKRMEIKDEKSKKRSEAGKKGAAKRWQKDSNAKSKAMAMPSNSDSKKSKVKESKVNKTNASESSNTKHSESSAISYWLNHVNSAASQPILEGIQAWINDFNGKHEIVIAAIDDMLFHDARSYSYLNEILNTWDSRGLNTIEKVNQHLENRSRSKRNGQKNSWDEKKLFDYWWAEKIGGHPSLEFFREKFSVTDQELEILKNEIVKRGMEDAIS